LHGGITGDGVMVGNGDDVEAARLSLTQNIEVADVRL
jgi:hypothetical protein